jgi:hypothetical protein
LILNKALLKLFNYCIQNRTAPQDWFTTILLRILKPGKPADNPESYRLVGLECCLLKCLTLLIDMWICAWVEAYEEAYKFLPTPRMVLGRITGLTITASYSAVPSTNPRHSISLSTLPSLTSQTPSRQPTYLPFG